MKSLGLKGLSLCGAALLHAGCGAHDAARGDADGSVVAGDGSMAGPGPLPEGPDGGWGNEPSTCAEANVKATRAPATVWLVVDNSFDMGQNTSQDHEPPWTKVRRVLLGPDGVIAALQENIRFGFMAPSGPLSAQFSTCMHTLRKVEPALNNHDAIAMLYPEEADSGAAAMPYYAMKAVLEHTLATPEAERGNIAVVLGRSPQAERLCPTILGTDFHAAIRELDEVVAQLTALGVKVYVFKASAGAPTGDAVVVNRIEQLAELGQTGRGPLSNSSPEDLAMELRQLSSALIGCDVRLNGDVTAGQECRGSVSVDGKKLECNSADGWRLKAPNLVEITGSPCAELKQKADVSIQAQFPCDAFILF